MYVENPNSGVAKAKVIKHEVEVNTFLSEISIRSVVLKKLNSSCIICITQLIHGRWEASFLIAAQWVSRSQKIVKIELQENTCREGAGKSNNSPEKQFSIVSET